MRLSVKKNFSTYEIRTLHHGKCLNVSIHLYNVNKNLSMPIVSLSGALSFPSLLYEYVLTTNLLGLSALCNLCLTVLLGQRALRSLRLIVFLGLSALCSLRLNVLLGQSALCSLCLTVLLGQSTFCSLCLTVLLGQSTFCSLCLTVC